ncbi:MAG: D-cysteine desulfhydrase family protein [Pseudomonadota bacterium]
MPGQLDILPRARLAHLPTPLEPMPRLAAALGLAEAWVKRDDCTGLAFGGNKARQLEFYLGEAVAAGADAVLITGAVQSNYVRQAAAAAARLGMAAHVQLEHRTPRDDPAYRASGNVLLDRLLGATIHDYPEGEDEAGADRALQAIADRLRARGRRPYVIHLGPGHPPLGALGYVEAARETLAQMAAAGIAPDEIVVPSGSGATHAGFLTGLRALGATIPVTGACVRRPAAAQRPRLVARCAEIAGLLGLANPVTADDIRLTDAALAPGYGQLNQATAGAIRLAARAEALVLDPVYSGKAMAAVIERARPGGRLMFLHTGGSPAVFAYPDEMAALAG